MLSLRQPDERLFSFKSLKEKFEKPRFGAGVQRSATNADMPNRGGTIAERLAALQAAGANDWRARVCRLSPDREDSKAIERAKNKINLWESNPRAWTRKIRSVPTAPNGRQSIFPITKFRRDGDRPHYPVADVSQT
ncbi:jg8722 [Pararge aegeria aegeria]|uniref:Jg8722 protein n=1 Tax=Pararge aegeria aegeria TaxID=348720 RepID=A0A8S4S556_9NEOP|nr:jg8722 [Pararge aegeria aegeria]